jgi:Flp pilus assembly protein TadD
MSQSDDSRQAETAGMTTTASVEACYAAGLEALERGELEDAQAWARRCDAATGSEQDARCAALHGVIAAETGDFDGAAVHFRRARQLAPDDVTIARRVAETLAESGAVGEAIRVLEEAAQRQPDDASLLIDLGYVRVMNGDKQGARLAIDRAAALRPEDRAMTRSLAQIYEVVGEPALAAELLSRLAGAAPSPRVLDDLARLYLQLERYSDAEGVFRSLRRLDPDHELFAQHGQTWCRIKSGDWRGALDVALSATRLDRYDLTTAFLAYAKDRLFGNMPDALEREAKLGDRFMVELHEHAELHSDEAMDLVEVREGVNRE